ncbi:MAG: SH3 domain-containing protein [Anaerolineae bacterium]|nr:SH3 domain-containing protein [Anaerolineae bacterium]
MGTLSNKRSIVVFALPITLALVSLGCGLSSVLGGGSSAAIEPTATRTPMPTFTPTAVSVAAVLDPAAAQDGAAPASQPVAAPPVDEAVVEEAPTEVPTAVVPTAAPDPTDTPNPEARATILQNMNIRGGPGTGYPVVGAGTVGQSSKIVGRNSDNSWVQVEYPGSSNGTGWVYSDLVQIDGDPNIVGVVQVAPPPAPTAAPEPTSPPEPEAPPPPPEPEYQFTPTGWHASHNAAIVHFKGRIRDEGGNLVNGYSVLVDNWSWSVISHPTGASHHYPEKGDGEWDVVIPNKNLGDGVGWWWLTVVRYECPDFLSRFDAQCSQFTRLSEDVKIMVNWPDETIINADWICHWDCNKGLYVDGFKR